MKKCCRETFKKCLEEVIFSIKFNKPESINEILGALEYAVSLLDKQNYAVNERTRK
jgi:hypothetical protein